MNILYLYNSTQTYTNAVFEHLAAFSKYSKHRSFFCHQDQFQIFDIDLSLFDVVVIHFTIRLPFDQISDSTAESLKHYSGLKVLFIQDEYDNTHKAWNWIKQLGFKLVFTVVPSDNITFVYPPEEFPDVRFVSNFTGYVPEELPCINSVTHPSERKLIIGYRGRPLPIRYGKLGQEKVAIGKMVKQYCDSKGIENDIAWTEDMRIYGPKWCEFMVSCRAMLSSESGSNVFAWDDSLDLRIEEFRKSNPNALEEDIYQQIVEPFERSGLMNQVSPRIFEAIASRTALVLFEGNYSGVVTPGLHYISLKKDGSNLDEVFKLLDNGDYIDKMTENAYRDVIASGKYSYQTFVQMVDEQISNSLRLLQQKINLARNIPLNTGLQHAPTLITVSPIRAFPPISIGGLTARYFLFRNSFVKPIAVYSWSKLPNGVREFLRPRLKRLLGRN